MDHYLARGCQDIRCDQTIGGGASTSPTIGGGGASTSPRSSVVRRTYDGPPPAISLQRRPASASHSTHIYLRRKQSRTMLFPREPSTAQSSEHSVRRSVSGMKNLLPLKLLSPTASELGIWPSSAPSHRTTFGLRPPQTVEERRSSMNEHTDSQWAHAAECPRRHRDTPIFAEAGTPLPSPAYSTHDDVCLQSPPSGFSCDETCIVDDYDKEKKSKHEDEPGDLQETIESICKGGDDSLLQSYWETDSRCSALSFQCSGEETSPREAAYLRSPLNRRHWPRPNAIHEGAMSASAEYSVENWLYNISEYFGEAGDSLACATILAPAKANIVDVSISRSSGLGLSIPPRTSSLDKSTPFPLTRDYTQHSWLSCSESPPATPADGDNSDTPSREPSFSNFSKRFQAPFSKLPPDLAMSSPPMSPDSGALAVQNLVPSPVTSTRRPDAEKPSWPLTDNTQLESTDDILSSLAEWMTNFPSTMLLPESACITAIRSQLSNRSSETRLNSQPQTSRPSLPAIPLDSLGAPLMESLRRRKTTHVTQGPPSFSTPERPTTQPPPLPSSSSSSKTITPLTLLPPDLQPIHNIFPASSKAMCASLYAYILAYIYVTSSVQTAPPTPSSPRHQRRDTPHWSSTSSQESATVLGTADAIPSSTSAKALVMQEDLRRCIDFLIPVMDEDFGVENTMGAESKNIERFSGMVFLRSLIEVVKSAEARTATSSAPVGFF